MRALRPGDLPLVTANFSAAARAIPVGGDPDEPSRYVEDFSGFQWIDDATMTGFLDLKLASRPAEPGDSSFVRIPWTVDLPVIERWKQP